MRKIKSMDELLADTRPMAVWVDDEIEGLQPAADDLLSDESAVLIIEDPENQGAYMVAYAYDPALS
jgi:hypothetical protein